MCCNVGSLTAGFISRQFAAAMADLHEAAKLCPNNREIRRLLARVEDECKQLQRAQCKGGFAGATAASGGHDSDQEQDEGEVDASEHSLSRSVEAQRDILEEEEEEEEEESEEVSLHDRTNEACCSQSSYSYSRVLASEHVNSLGHQTPSLPPGPSRPPLQRYPREHREAPPQQGLVLQPTRQAQIVKTNQHMSSMQAGGGPAGGRAPGSKSQYAPSSPLPSRHMSSMLKPGPGIDISLLSPPADEPVYGNRVPTAKSCENDSHHSFQIPHCSSSSKALGQDRLSAQSAPSLEGGAGLGPGPQDKHGEAGKEATCGAAGWQSSSIRVSSSSSSLASSSSLPDSSKLGPDVRSKLADKSKQGQQAGSAADYKPRPFMGITDKTARFQQQQQQQQQSGRGWLNHSSDLLANELPYAKSASTYQEQHKPPPAQGAVAISNVQNGMHAKELAEKFCQAASCYKESKPALAMTHTFIDGKPKQPALTRDNSAIHVTSMKPKRSFIESNV